MRRVQRLAAMVVAAFATVSSAADPASPIDVDAIRVRFRAASRANDVLDLRFSFAADEAPAFDPTHDDVTLDVGSAGPFRVGPDVAAVARVRRNVVTYRRARGDVIGVRSPFRRLTIDFRRGRVHALVDHVDAAALRQDVHWNVPVALRVGGSTFSTAVYFGVSRDGASWKAPARPDRNVRRIPDTWFDFQSSVDEPRELVVRDDAAWTALWAEHVKDVDPKPGIPFVDFSRDVVVAVFRQGTGTGLALDGFETKSDRIVTHFTVSHAGHNCLVLQFVAHEYAFALLPRTDLPFEFDEREIVVDCLR